MRRFARLITLVAVLGGLAYACTVGDVDYTGKTCAGSCPSGLACIGGFCQPPTTQPDASDAQAFPDTGFDCAAHAFCDDFTLGQTLGGKWDSLQINGTTMDIDTDAWTSPPSSLFVDVPDAAYRVSGSLGKAFHVTTSLPHLAFNWDVRVDVASADQTIWVTMFNVAIVDPDLGAYSVSLYIIGAAWTFLAQGQMHDGGPAPGTLLDLAPLPVGVWRHVTVDLFTAPTTSFAVAFDGQSVAKGTLVSFANATSFNTSFGVTTTYFPQGTHGWELRFDNFTEDSLAQ